MTDHICEPCARTNKQRSEAAFAHMACTDKNCACAAAGHRLDLVKPKNKDQPGVSSCE